MHRDLVKSRYKVFAFDGGIDYRRVPRALSHVYFLPLNCANRCVLHEIFRAISPPGRFAKPRPPAAHLGVNAQCASEHLDRRVLPLRVTVRPTTERGGLPRYHAQLRTGFVEDVPRMCIGQKDMVHHFRRWEVPRIILRVTGTDSCPSALLRVRDDGCLWMRDD